MTRAGVAGCWLGLRMGANARRRRDAKARSRAAFDGFAASLDSSNLSRMMRRTCSQCGSDEIEWASLGSQTDDSAEQRGFARKMLPMLSASADAWTCGECGEMGAFEQTVHSSFD